MGHSSDCPFQQRRRKKNGGVKPNKKKKQKQDQAWPKPNRNQQSRLLL